MEHKNKNLLTSSGNVEIFDPINNVRIYSDKITYKKNDELIFTKGNSKAIGSNFIIEANNFQYNKLKNIITIVDISTSLRGVMSKQGDARKVS